MRFWSNLSLAKRLAAEIGRNDAHEVHGAIQRRCPDVLALHVRYDELSRDERNDLCFAVQSELARGPRRLGS